MNVGPGLQVVNAEQADPSRAGSMWAPPTTCWGGGRADERVALRLMTDVQDVLREPGDPTTLAVGLELDVQRAVFLRAGYAPGEGLGTGAAVGVELRYDRFDIAVARSFVNSQLAADTEPFQVSFGLNF
jgi:hypothetical protein